MFVTVDSPLVSCFTTYRPEAHVIEEITSTVWKSLNQEFLHVEKNLVGMDQRRASSTCTSIGSWDYEVFLSFKGEDTRYNFTDHLYVALFRKGFIPLDWMRSGEKTLHQLFLKLLRSQGASLWFSQNALPTPDGVWTNWRGSWSAGTKMEK